MTDRGSEHVVWYECWRVITPDVGFSPAAIIEGHRFATREAATSAARAWLNEWGAPRVGTQWWAPPSMWTRPRDWPTVGGDPGRSADAEWRGVNDRVEVLESDERDEVLVRIADVECRPVKVVVTPPYAVEGRPFRPGSRETVPLGEWQLAIEDRAYGTDGTPIEVAVRVTVVRADLGIRGGELRKA